MLIKDGNYEKKFHSIQFFSTYIKKSVLFMALQVRLRNIYVFTQTF